MLTRSLPALLTFGLLIMGNLSRSQTLTLLSQVNYVEQLGTDVWEYVSSAEGRTYVVAGDLGSFVIVDVTIPDNPVQVSRVQVPSFDLKVFGDIVYSVDGGGGGFMTDISDPSNPIDLGVFEGGHNIFIDENGRLFNTAGNIYNVLSDGTMPSLIGNLGQQHTIHDLTVRGDLVISCDGNFGTRVYDIATIEKPDLLMQFVDGDFGYHHHGDFSREQNYLFVTDEFGFGAATDIFVWDIQDRDNPSLATTLKDLSSAPHNLYVRGDYLFVSYYTAGLKVFDIKQPADPILVAQFDTKESIAEQFVGAWGVYPSPHSEVVYLTDTELGLLVFGFDTTSTSTGIFDGQSSDLGISIYPTLSESEFYIYNEQNLLNLRFYIQDLQGRIIQEGIIEGQSKVGIQLLANAGVYFLTVEGPQGVFSRQIVNL